MITHFFSANATFMLVIRFLCLYLLLLSCSNSSYKVGREMSNSIEESKSNKLFYYQYITSKNPHTINDTVSITVREAWIEDRWKYNENGLIRKVNGYQLIILCNPDDIEDYPFKWTIGSAEGTRFRACGQGCLMADFDSIPEEREVWVVQKGTLKANKPPQVIGLFELVRKR